MKFFWWSLLKVKLNIWMVVQYSVHCDWKGKTHVTPLLPQTPPPPMAYYKFHRVIILNRGSRFAIKRREFSPPLSSAHRLLQCYHRQKRDKRRCNWNSPSAPATRVISQWASSLEWRHAVTLHILVGKICISFFLFYCEGMLSLVVLWLCDTHGNTFCLLMVKNRRKFPWFVVSIIRACHSSKNESIQCFHSLICFEKMLNNFFLC